MKSIAEMKQQLATIKPAAPAKEEPKTDSSVRETAVNVLGSAVPVVKKGLSVTTKATGDFLSDVATVYQYKEAVRLGKIDTDAPKPNVRARAR